MITYKKILIVAGAALLLGGCSWDFNGLLKGKVSDDALPAASPYVDTQTQTTPDASAGTMGSGSYSLQGTTTIGSGTDDTTLEKDLDQVNVNSNLEGLTQ